MDKTLSRLRDAVVLMKADDARKVAEEALESGIPAVEAINDGLVAGMLIVGEKFKTKEYFVPEILACSKAFYAGLDILRPLLKPGQMKKKGEIVIGVVEGDVHDIGKNIVKIMLEADGYRIHDLGRDVKLSLFIEQAEQVGADMIAISSLMSTSMFYMGKVIDLLRESGLRDRVKVIVGGAPVFPGFARKIGADGYARDAMEAVKEVGRLLEVRGTNEIDS